MKRKLIIYLLWVIVVDVLLFTSTALSIFFIENVAYAAIGFWVQLILFLLLGLAIAALVYFGSQNTTIPSAVVEFLFVIINSLYFIGAHLFNTVVSNDASKGIAAFLYPGWISKQSLYPFIFACIILGLEIGLFALRIYNRRNEKHKVKVEAENNETLSHENINIENSVQEVKNIAQQNVEQNPEVNNKIDP